MVINSNEAIKQSVQVGLGLAIIPLQSVTQELGCQRLVVLDVAQMPLQRSWSPVHRKEKHFSRVAEAFRDFVLKQAAMHLDGGAHVRRRAALSRLA